MCVVRVRLSDSLSTVFRMGVKERLKFHRVFFATEYKKEKLSKGSFKSSFFFSYTKKYVVRSRFFIRCDLSSDDKNFCVNPVVRLRTNNMCFAGISVVN